MPKGQPRRKVRTSSAFRGSARTYALKLLRYRARSVEELRARLKQKGFGDGEREDALQYLERAGLLDDKALAAQILTQSTERRFLGRKGIELLLASRGIDRELIGRTLASHTREMEESSAARFVQAKLRVLGSYPPQVAKQRLWGMLRRRGYPSDIITRILASIDETL